VPLEIAFDTSLEVRDALERLARTEDVRFSPNGKRLAIAGFARGRIAIAEVEITRDDSGPSVAVSAIEEVESPALLDPHGLDFVDDDTLVVGNRGGGVSVLRLEAAGAELVATTESVPDDPASLLDAPGSVVVRREAGRIEVLACNNAGHTVTRHRLDSAGRLVAGEIVARRGLDIPDGLALSADGRWLAVSNHNTHSALLYDYARLGEDAEPAGVLRGITYPHGIRFGRDDRVLVVADAGAPFVHVFTARVSGWEGVAYPAATFRVMDDETFRRGRHNTQEGGPKGIDLDLRSNVLVATAECLPLAFFDLGTALESAAGPDEDALIRYEREVLDETASTKAAAAGEIAALRAELTELQADLAELHVNAAQQAAGLSAEIERIAADAARLGAECDRLHVALAESHAALDHVHSSTSWRVTAPLRRAVEVARGVARR
jgi:hypothetical protein